MSKDFIGKMGDKIVEKFPDNVQVNALFEIAQKMLDEGKDKKEIKKILKDLYGASKDELDRMEEKLFKNKVNAEVSPNAVLTELKAIVALQEEYEFQDQDERDVSPHDTEPTTRLKALIKELEGDKGKRQEAPIEKSSSNTWYNGPLIFKTLQEVRGHVELSQREPGTEEAMGHSLEALKIIDHMIAELDESKDELAD